MKILIGVGTAVLTYFAVGFFSKMGEEMYCRLYWADKHRKEKKAGK